MKHHYDSLLFDGKLLKASYRVYKDDYRTLHLSLTDLRMFALLMITPEKPVSFEKLLCLPEVYESDRQRLATRLSRLRKDIIRVTGHNMIWSCKGHGYFICSDEDKADQIQSEYSTKQLSGNKI